MYLTLAYLLRNIGPEPEPRVKRDPVIQERRLVCLERNENIEHRHFMGEELGRPVSEEEAFLDYAFSNGLRVRLAFETYSDSINRECDSRCGYDVCKGFEDCNFNLDDVHTLLHD